MSLKSSNALRMRRVLSKLRKETDIQLNRFRKIQKCDAFEMCDPYEDSIVRCVFEEVKQTIARATDFYAVDIKLLQAALELLHYTMGQHAMWKALAADNTLDSAVPLLDATLAEKIQLEALLMKLLSNIALELASLTAHPDSIETVPVIRGNARRKAAKDAAAVSEALTD
jgi:ferritin-like metal-binding protein YciE